MPEQMTMRQATEMALEALQSLKRNPNIEIWSTEADKTMEALRQALAQPEQEPVAGMFEEKLPDQNPPPWVRDYRPKREWVGLTDEEAREIRLRVGSAADVYARAIEAALKEKNI